MPRVLVIGDDLTGSNGTANGLVRLGLRAGTLRAGPERPAQPEQPERPARSDEPEQRARSERPASTQPSQLSGSAQLTGSAHRIASYRDTFDALVLTTDSRHLPAAEAALLSEQATRAGWPAALVSSRCDSTVRGNVGPEAEAVIRTVRSLTEQHVMGLCMPAFPSASRQTVGGLQLMDGRKLEETELARDVRSPVTTSSLEAILTRDTRLTCAHVDIAAVEAGGAELETAFRQALESAPDVLIADARTDDHLRQLARTAVTLRPEMFWVGIDPGPGTWALTQALGLAREPRASPSETACPQSASPQSTSSHTTSPHTSTSKTDPDRTTPPGPVSPETPAPAAAPETSRTGTSAPLLAVSGSATERTRDQLAHLIRERDCAVVRAEYVPGEKRIDPEASAAAVLREVHAGRAQLIVLATVLSEEDLLDLTPAQGDAIPEALGEAVARVLAEASVRGLYTTGGDITAAVLEHVDGAGIEVHGEVIPLAAAGTIVGGPADGLPIVTKGGLVGDETAAIACLDALSEVRPRERPEGAWAPQPRGTQEHERTCTRTHSG